MKLGQLQGYVIGQGYSGGMTPEPPFITEISLPNNYDDISSIVNFVELYSYISTNFGMKDLKCLQREIYEEALVITLNDLDTNWNNLSEPDKLLVCEYCTSKVPPIRFLETYPDANMRQSISQNFDMFNVDVRQTKRYPIIRMYLFNKIGTQNALESLKTATTDNLVTEWFGGIEGTIEDGGIVGLFDYILARAGTPYETTGLAVQSYPVIDGSGMTLQQVADEIYEIGKNGLY
jgi:hypothetical protein